MYMIFKYHGEFNVRQWIGYYCLLICLCFLFVQAVSNYPDGAEWLWAVQIGIGIVGLKLAKSDNSGKVEPLNRRGESEKSKGEKRSPTDKNY